MFSLEDAQRLRDSLGPLDLRSAGSGGALVEGYRKFYGLEFDDQGVAVTHRMGNFSSGPFCLAGQHFSPPPDLVRGTAFIVHGYYDHVGLFRHLIRHFLRQRLAVVTFDLPGHGLSSGEAASIDSFRRYSQALTDCLALARGQAAAQPWQLVGQSTGGAAIIDCLLGQGSFDQFDFRKIVLLAPLLRPVGWVGGRLKLRLLRLILRRVKRYFAANSHDREFLDFIATRDPLQARHLSVDWVASLDAYLAEFERSRASDRELLIIQGTADKTVDWRYNLPRLQEKFPRARTRLIEGARHHLVNESEQYREQIFAAFEDVAE